MLIVRSLRLYPTYQCLMWVQFIKFRRNIAHAVTKQKITEAGINTAKKTLKGLPLPERLLEVLIDAFFLRTPHRRHPEELGEGGEFSRGCFLLFFLLRLCPSAMRARFTLEHVTPSIISCDSASSLSCCGNGKVSRTF